MQVVPLLVPALLVAVVPVAVFRAAGVPAPSRAYLRWALFAVPGLFVAELLASETFGPAVGPLVGLGTNLLVGVTSAVRARAYMRRERLVAELRGGSPAAIAAVDAVIAGFASSRSTRRIEANAWTLRFAETALVANLPEPALRWLHTLPPVLEPALAGAAAQYRAAAHLRLGQIVAARHALASTTRPAATPAFELALQALDALVDVIDGAPGGEARADAALAGAALPDALRITWSMVKAHALAARAAGDEARTLLRELREAHGDEVVARVVRHGGPASGVAERLLASEGPYR